MDFLSKLRSMKWTVLALILYTLPLYSQKEVAVTCIAFYNLENLFDTLDSPDTDDVEFTPTGPNLYTSAVYEDKLQKLSRVIAELGTLYTPDGPAILGVSEIENRSVLEDLAYQPLIRSRGYEILHQDSRDARGVDVAFLYQPKYFVPDTVLYYPLITDTVNNEIDYSRDIVFAIGTLAGEKVAISVNHWPSRRGGEQTTAHLRKKAAAINRHVLDSLRIYAGIDKSIVMGDLNDDPVNDSVRKVLRANKSREGLEEHEMYNPMEEYYRKGLGTTAYRDAWSLFDQIILSAAFVNKANGFHYYKAVVHNPSYLTQKSGPFKGYPFRCYSNGSYTGGYSDHFPVYVLLVKEKA